MMHTAVIALLIAIEGAFELPPMESPREAEERRVRAAYDRHVDQFGVSPARIFTTPHGVAFAVRADAV